MDRLDRLLIKAKPKKTIVDKLNENNPYMKYSREELIDFLDGYNYRAPDMGTWEWEQFMWATMHSWSDGRCEKEGWLEE